MNYSVGKVLGIIIGQIQQKDGLWKGKAFSKEDLRDEGIKDENNGLFGKFGLMAMCGGREKLEDEEEDKKDYEEDDRQDSSDEEIDKVEKLQYEAEEDKKKEDSEKEFEEKKCVIF